MSASAHAAMAAAFGEDAPATATTDRALAAWCEEHGHIYWWTGPDEDPTDGAWRLPKTERGFRTFENPDAPDDLDDDLDDGEDPQ